MSLQDILGMQILLWAGDPIPFPDPSLTNALLSAEVTQTDDGDGFQLRFAIAQDGALPYPLLSNRALAVFSKVTVAVMVGPIPNVLINGVITHVQVDPHPEPGQSTMTVSGRDVSVMMDLEEKNEEYPNQPDFVIVAQILARYPDLGLIPVVTPTTDFPIFLQRIPRQAETDLQFVRRLAKRNGFVFHVNPTLPNLNQAVFAPELRAALPQPALSINTITADNVTALHFTNDGLAPVGVAGGGFIEPVTKAIVPIPEVPSLRLPPLVLSPTPTERKDFLRESAKESPSRAVLSSVAVTSGAPEAVTGTGEVDTEQYGSVMRARGLIGVRGVSSYDGFYYLRQVTHHLETGKYTQSFVMTREGTESISPAVIP
jgi:hypothetical protein